MLLKNKPVKSATIAWRFYDNIVICEMAVYNAQLFIKKTAVVLSFLAWQARKNGSTFSILISNIIFL